MQQFYKHSIVFFLFFLIGLLPATSQDFSDLGFSFQGYARNLDGAALSSTSINVQFSIYIPGNAAEFTEEHTLTTDPFGVFQTVVGSEQTTAFEELDFSSKKYFMKVEVRPVGGTYATISDQALNSVPYAQAAQNGVPVGTILPFAAPSANIPDGYALCDGSAVSSATYPALFAALGTAWGDGSSGSGDFNLPDLRGMFLRGVSGTTDNDPDKGTRTAQNPGGNTGNSVGSVQQDTLQSHGHTMSTAGQHSHGANPNHPEHHGFVARNGGGTNTNPTDPAPRNTEINVTAAHNFSPDGNHTHAINATGGNESRPLNAYVTYIIRVR